jgi:hypothetical protein
MQRSKGDIKQDLQARIPYLDCKLTRVLRDSLLDPLSSVLLILTVMPERKFQKDTVHCLLFG